MATTKITYNQEHFTKLLAVLIEHRDELPDYVMDNISEALKAIALGGEPNNWQLFYELKPNKRIKHYGIETPNNGKSWTTSNIKWALKSFCEDVADGYIPSWPLLRFVAVGLKRYQEGVKGQHLWPEAHEERGGNQSLYAMVRVIDELKILNKTEIATVLEIANSTLTDRYFKKITKGKNIPMGNQAISHANQLAVNIHISTYKKMFEGKDKAFVTQALEQLKRHIEEDTELRKLARGDK
ncbi:hypothetical protein [Shewanella putrefaciens]|uniref:hypothetical protein n=1 Tax=Shewanella putrefaciens TaxID=24 RepID=UPI0013548DC0|nr:hypothetical protein SHEWT2_01436 [Shewanella hafniensis]